MSNNSQPSPILQFVSAPQPVGFNVDLRSDRTVLISFFSCVNSPDLGSGNSNISFSTYSAIDLADLLDSHEPLKNPLDPSQATFISMQDLYFDKKVANFLSSSFGDDLLNASPTDSFNIVTTTISPSGTVGYYSDFALQCLASKLNQISEIKKLDMDVSNDIFSFIPSTRGQTLVNNKILNNIIHNSSADSLNNFHTPFSFLADEAQEIQNSAVNSFITNQIVSNEYEILAEATNMFAQPPEAFGESIVIGYEIKKEKIYANGKTDPPVSIFKAQPSSPGTEVIIFDTEIDAGYEYIYTLHAVLLTRYLNVIGQGGDLEIGEFVLLSNGESRLIDTSYLAPLPPSDLQFEYIRNSNDVYFHWSFPAVGASQIDKFQIFKRSSVTEPYALLREYKLKNSTAANTEIIDYGLTVLQEDLEVFYIDENFNKFEPNIYCICSVDVFGKTSGYSAQYQVDYQALSNGIEIKRISQEGAPKAYPNFYISSILAENLLKISRPKKAAIYLDPDVKELYSVKYSTTTEEFEESNTLVLKVGKEEKYRIQFINLNNQQTQDLEIKINEK